MEGKKKMPNDTVPGKKLKTPSGLLVKQKPPRERTKLKVNEAEMGRFKEDLYNTFPDFGNFGLIEKVNSIERLFTLRDRPIDMLPEDVREDIINKILVDLGEEDTYGVTEFLWDAGVPSAASWGGAAVGTAVGGPPGGIVGAILGGGLGAGGAEVLKAYHERGKRGIPPPEIDEMIDTGKWPAILETAFGIIPPLAQLARLKAARIGLLPEGNLKNLPSDITDAARITGKYRPQVSGSKASRWIKRASQTIRWGPSGPRTALGVEQLNAHQESVLSNLADLLASSWFGGPLFKKQAGHRVKAVQEEFKFLFSQKMNYMDSFQLGKITEEMLQENILNYKSWGRLKWAQASSAIDGKGYKVDLTRFNKYLNKISGRAGQTEEAKKLREIVEGYFKRLGQSEDKALSVLAADLGEEGIPKAADATLVDALWHDLNGVGGDMQKFARQAAREARDDLMEHLKNVDEKAYELFAGAKDFHEYYKTVHDGEIIQGILKGISRDARKLEGFILSSESKLGNLQMIKEAIEPKNFNGHVLPALRWRYMDAAQATDAQFGKIFSGNALINKMKKDGLAFAEDGKTVLRNEYLEEFFGGRRNVQSLVDFARAADIAQSGAAGNKIIMKIFEASQIVGVSTATSVKQMGTTTGLLISPVALSYTVFANPRFLRELTDGLIGYHAIEDIVATTLRLNAQSSEKGKELMKNVDNLFKLEPYDPEANPAMSN